MEKQTNIKTSVKKIIGITLGSLLIFGFIVGCWWVYEEYSWREYEPINKPVNYMDEIKKEVHDSIFRSSTQETQEIIDKIFNHLEIETFEAFVDGDQAIVQMHVTTVNAGRAWITGLEKYAIECATNLFIEDYVDDSTLYSYYLDEFEKAVRKADYILIPVQVEMEYENHRWVWDINDDVINAITGYLLAAIEGDINSSFMIETIPTDPPSSSTEENDNLNDEVANVDTVTPTLGMINAEKSARSYLKWGAFSREGLYNQLEFEGYTVEEIEYALTRVGY